MILRKLVTNGWVLVSPGFVTEDEGGMGAVEITCAFFGGFLLGGSNAEKWGDHQKKKFFLNKSVEALILIKAGHQGLLKLHVFLGGSFSVGKKWGYPQNRNFV